MVFSSLRRGKSQASFPSDRRPRLRTRRPLVEPMENRVVLTAASATVTQLYQDLLHRLPDAGGLAFWAGQLDRGADTVAVAAALTHSTEFHQGQVDGVYQRLLGRAADEGGRAFFASALDHGQTVPQVEAAVAASPEYAQAHGGASGFLDALFNGTDHLKTLVSGAYQQVLHRAGDAAGLAYWAERMSAGTSLDDVTASLASSAERAARAAPTSTVLGTFSDSSALPLGGAGTLEASLAGAAHAALSAGAGALPQAVTLKNGLPAVFQAFGPERLVDTRNPTAGQYGGPAFAAASTRTLNVSPYNLSDPSIPSPVVPGEQAPTSNLPVGVTAVSLILFIVGAPQAEYFTAYATGTSPAPIGTATVFADHAGQTIAASALVPVNAAGNINIYSSGGGNLVVDITGYFLNTLDGTDNLPISGNVSGSTSGVIVGTNTSTSGFANGVTGVVSTTAQSIGSAGVRGINNSTNGASYGVFGSQAGNGYGVLGTAGNNGIGGNFIAGTDGIGVQGVVGNVSFPAGGTGVAGSAFGAGSIGGNFDATDFGVVARAQGTGAVGGVLGQVSSTSAAAGSAGVRGTNASTANASSTEGVYGVLGEITSTSPGDSSAGVRGANHDTANKGYGVYGSTAGAGVGVYGATEGTGVGVDGYSRGGLIGVRGLAAFATPTGGTGVQGTASGTGSFGVRGFASGSSSFGVFSSGNTGATGIKSFVDPNPVDASKQIAYVSLEGPEAGTYFRGRGHITLGTATIDVPESFRLVTDPAGMTVQITPIGSLATVAVQSMDLDRVVVLGSQDLDFSYLVQGVRKGYLGYDPVQPNRIYVPHSATDTLPAWLTDTQRQTLIGNGTYHADGTVNLTTAHNLGWDRLWTTSAGTGVPSAGATS